MLIETPVLRHGPGSSRRRMMLLELGPRSLVGVTRGGPIASGGA